MEATSVCVAPSVSDVGAQTDVVERIVRNSCLTNRVLELIILPTEQCNFRCTYCYEDFSIGNMKGGVVDAICLLLEKRGPTLDRLKVNYFGGEPLLNMKAIRSISSAALALRDRFGFEYVSEMTTNAYLLDEARLEELLALECSNFQVSLDGWGEVHDLTRRQRSQSGSFERIWNNLLALKATKREFNVLLRVHMTPQNAHSLDHLVDMINRELGDDRFNVMFKAVGQWGGEADDHPEVFAYGSKALVDLHTRLMAKIDRALSIGIDESGGGATVASMIRGDVQPEGVEIPTICYASKSNSLVVRANGRINKCTVALKSSANDVGYIDLDGSLRIDSGKLMPWLGGVQTLDERYLGCPASRIVF